MTSNPVAAPTLACAYPKEFLCKSDVLCIWKATGKKEGCTLLDCAKLNKLGCIKERQRCNWDEEAMECSPET